MSPAFAPNDIASSVTTKFVHASMNKIRCPINVVRWTPEGRRLLTGASTGEFTFWNGVTFNFETILQAHDTAIRAMSWSHNGNFLISGDHMGVLKIWQPSLNNLKILQGHKEPIRNITFSPSDGKFASCSDDGLIKVWDFAEASEERTLTGHGWDVRTVDWHPYKSLLASGSKDNLVKLWDPKAGTTLATIHGHKNTIIDLKWNKNGNWLASAGKDQTIKLFDIRMMKEFQSLKGHSKEINNIAWHPVHESLFATASGDGSALFWSASCDRALGSLHGAHEGIIWSLDWHPVGHVLATGSADCSVRFWIRQRPGDNGLDYYQLGKQAAEAMGIRPAEPVAASFDDDDESVRDEEFSAIPGVNSRSFRQNRNSSRDSGPPSHEPHGYRSSQSNTSSYSSNPHRAAPPPPPPPRY